MQVESSRCNFRCIVPKDGTYHIFEEDLIDGHWRIFKRISADGLTFGERGDPLFPLGERGAFDEWGQADPSVMYDGVWKMWFDAMDRSYHWDKIGYAESVDGENWQIKGTAIQRGGASEWDEKSVHHPVVIKENGCYGMYYSGCREGEPHNVRHIGLATSRDGLTWDKEGIVIEAGFPDEWDGEYVRPSNPVRLCDEWVMFYWGFNKVHGMGLATSKDLIHWNKRMQLMTGTNIHDGVTASWAISDGRKARVWYTEFDRCRVHLKDFDIDLEVYE